jgi:hypothetical protein
MQVHWQAQAVWHSHAWTSSKACAEQSIIMLCFGGAAVCCAAAAGGQAFNPYAKMQGQQDNPYAVSVALVSQFR